MSDDLGLPSLDIASARAARLRDLRQRVLAGEDVPPDEYAEVIADLRATRTAAAAPAARKRAEPAKPFDPDMLF